MKKTMIAMAVAGVVAAPMASAEVAVSGYVEQTFTDTDGTGAAWTGSTSTGIDFKASEDLGNGLTAFAQISLDTDNANGTNQDGAATDEKDSKLGISGGFGTLVFGRMEDFTEGKVMSMMTLNGTGAIEAAGNAGRTDDAVAYVSPTVAGFHVGLAGYAVTPDDDAFDATNVAVFYDNGPLSIKIADEDRDRSTQSLAIGASYTYGDLKISAVNVEWDDVGGTPTADNTDFMARLDYTMGNNKITLANLDDETGAGAAGTDVTALEVTHTMSSRTSVYAGVTDSDAVNADTTYVGMIHKF